MPYDKLKRPEGCAPEPVHIKSVSVEPGICDTVSCMIKSRRSIRKYLPKDFRTRLWSGCSMLRICALCRELQPWEFIVVRNPR
jgi:hypothetical protein